MKPGLHTTLDNFAKVAAGIKKIADTRVLVGVPADKDPRKAGDPVSNADLAYIHDNGAPDAGIPAREFLKPGIKAKQSEIEAGLVKTGNAALDGKPDAVERGFNIVGIIGQNAVRAKINEGVPPPLQPATIAARKRRKRTGTKPLIDTGQLRNAITYVVRKS
jgi:hypothetical protein